MLRSTQCWGLEGGRDGNRTWDAASVSGLLFAQLVLLLQLEEKRGLGKSLWPVLYHSVTRHLASEPPAVYCTLSIDHSSKTVALLWLRLKFSLNERSLSRKFYLRPALSCSYCSDAHTHHDASDICPCALSQTVIHSSDIAGNPFYARHCARPRDRAMKGLRVFCPCSI